jgi:hypothetical protein
MAQVLRLSETVQAHADETEAEQFVGRIGAKRNPPFAHETKASYGFASNPPYAPMPVTHRDLPVGCACVRSSSLLPPSQAISVTKSLAPKN